MGLFRAIVLILTVALFFYISHQLTRFAELSFITNLAVLGFLAIIFMMLLSLPMYFWMKPGHEHKKWHDRYFLLTHLAIGYVNFLIVAVILRDIIAFFTNFFVTSFETANLYSAAATGVMLMVPVILTLIGSLVVRLGPHLVKVDISFKDLPKDLEGLRILHITDLHISRSLPTSFIHKLIKVAKKNPADLVVYTGDILDDIPSRYVSDTELLKTIPSKHGNFYVPGNHEYYWDANKTITAFKDLGFKVLINQSQILKIGTAELQICGVPDPAAQMFKLEEPNFDKLAAEFKSESFKILLSHQPTLADAAAPYGFELQLSGHTHGGQFFPWNVLLGFFEKYGKGLYQIQNLKLYVNQGTGYWGPSLRLGTYCEVAEVTLRRE